jgi:hypothetical protein
MLASSSVSKFLFVIGVLMAMAVPGFSHDKNETIGATAWGTSTQLGENVNVTLIIYQYSTPADHEILVEAFQQGSNQGLVNALQKMKAVGHVSITGTLGYDVSYIEMVPTPTGRKILFVTNRRIEFGEAYFDTRSKAYDLSGGEIDINTQEKSKSSGVVFPAAQLGINDQGQLSIHLLQNPWRLSGIIDWPGTQGEN